MAAQFLLALRSRLRRSSSLAAFEQPLHPTSSFYRRWGPTVRIPYSQIDRIEVTNATPLGKQPIGAFVVTRRGERFPFWPKLFPREAVKRFFALPGWRPLSTQS